MVLYIRGQQSPEQNEGKTVPVALLRKAKQRGRMSKAASVFRFKKPGASARGASFFRNTRRVLGQKMEAGQSVLEYAILIAIVAAAFITMALYVRRAIQGQLYQMEGMVTAKANGTPIPSVYVPPI